MTCSVYATVAVAVNRYVDLSPDLRFPYWLDDGNVQSLIVLVFSVAFNLSRWFEFQWSWKVVEKNVTNPDTGIVLGVENVTVPMVSTTDLRKDYDYIRWYSLFINALVMNFGPALVMIYCSYKVYRRLKEVTASLAMNDDRIRARVKRNQSISRTLFGIIVMFLVCHTGKVRLT